jgi:hypothetical protein
MARHQLTIDLAAPTVQALQQALEEARAKGAPPGALFSMAAFAAQALTGSRPQLTLEWDDAPVAQVRS